MNIVLLTGNVTKDPVMLESKETGKPFCKIRFAAEENYIPGVARKTHFLDLFAFGGAGQRMNRDIVKGIRLFVRGKLTVNQVTSDRGYRIDHCSVTVDYYEIIEKYKTTDQIFREVKESGKPLIPPEVTESIIKAINADDEDMPYNSSLPGGEPW